jgi:hypothetical protein
MSDENFRRDLNQVFDEVAGSPSSNMRDRVRNAVSAPPAARGAYWIAAVAAAVIAILLVGVLLINGPMRGSQSPAGLPRPTPSHGASPIPFLCRSQALVTSASDGNPVPSVAYISSVQMESRGSYDVLTIEFSNGLPQNVQVSALTDGTTFTTSPSGVPVTLKGDRSILITIHGADLHTSYSGSTDLATGEPTIAEVRRVQDFEGVVQLGLGLNGARCYGASWTTLPEQLVIYVQAG